MLKLFTVSLLATFLSFSATAEEETVYELELESDANWSSVEIRDDAVFVNAPAGENMNATSKDGLRSLTITQKKIYFRNRSRSSVNMNLFVKTKNNVLGLTICKGSPSSFTSVSSGQARQKNDLKEKDHCDQAALVLQLF